MSTKKAHGIRTRLRKYAKLLEQMHGELQGVRLQIQPQTPMRSWSIEAMNFVWDIAPDEVAEQILEAEFCCMRAGEELRDLLRSQRLKLLGHGNT